MHHIKIQTIGKKEGGNAIEAAANRAVCKLSEHIIDKETGIFSEKIHDYSGKKRPVFSKILTPENAPSWAADREVLWNKIQHIFETRRYDAQLARELDIALPLKLTAEENIDLLQEFVHEAFVKKGMIADVNFHNDNPENSHAHVMLSLREIISDGNGDYTFGNKVRHWNNSEFWAHISCIWIECLNKYCGVAEFSRGDNKVSHH